MASGQYRSREKGYDKSENIVFSNLNLTDFCLSTSIHFIPFQSIKNCKNGFAPLMSKGGGYKDLSGPLKNTLFYLCVFPPKIHIFTVL